MKSVAVLLASYNGELYIEEQVQSILNQDYTNIKIYISDDGSSDNTKTIIQKLQEKNPKTIYLFEGPQSGFGQNFLSLIRNEYIVADYFSFCDQDDIWDYNKISKAIEYLEQTDPYIPNLYCSRTELIDKYESYIGKSPNFKRKPDIKNSLVQNIATGNTIVINNKSRELVKRIPPDLKIITHDWCIYQIISAHDGLIIFDRNSHIKYRQHDSNIIGANNSSTISSRIKKIIQGVHLEWKQSNLKVLDLFLESIPSNNKKIILEFGLLNSKSLYKRIHWVLKNKIHRQTTLSQMMLYLGVILNKI